MAVDGGGEGVGGTTDTETVAATSSSYTLPAYATIILLRCPSTNAGTVYVKMGKLTATTNDMEIRPGENIQFDFSQFMHLKMIMLGSSIDWNDFPKQLQYIGTANDELMIDAFSVM